MSTCEHGTPVSEDCAEELDPVDILEGLDPDWRDHFIDPSDAVAHYKQFAPVEYERAVRECLE